MHLNQISIRKEQFQGIQDITILRHRLIYQEVLYIIRL